jgi:hypothetical protein
VIVHFRAEWMSGVRPRHASHTRMNSAPHLSKIQQLLSKSFYPPTLQPSFTIVTMTPSKLEPIPAGFTLSPRRDTSPRSFSLTNCFSLLLPQALGFSLTSTVPFSAPDGGLGNHFSTATQTGLGPAFQPGVIDLRPGSALALPQTTGLRRVWSCGQRAEQG